MARHLIDPAAHSLYETIARLTNLAEAEKENQEICEANGAAGFRAVTGTLYASVRVLADAAGMSRNWAQKQLKKLEEKKIVKSVTAGRVRKSGTLRAHTYAVLTHFEIAFRDGCPPCRFDADGRVTRRRASAKTARRFPEKRCETVDRTCTTPVVLA